MALPWQMPNFNRRFNVGSGSASSGYPAVTLPQPNTSGIIQIPRSTQQGAAVQQAWQANTGNQGQVNQTLADYTKNYLASAPAAKGYADQETAAIGKFYGKGRGSVAGELAWIEERRANAINQAAAGAVRQASRANTLRRMGSGNNSANDRLYAQMLMGIAADSAQQRTANDASNYRYVADNQRGLAGARQKLLGDLAMRDLAPADAALSFQSRGLSNLGALANLENSNTIYDDTALRRQQLLNSLI